MKKNAKFIVVLGLILFIIASFAVLNGCKDSSTPDDNNQSETPPKDTQIDEHVHSYGEWITVTEATCTTDGSKKRVCSVCKSEQTEKILSLGHTYGEWKVVTEATCTTNGSKKRTCSVCKHEETENIPALGHSFTNYLSDGNATCMQDGTKTATCDRDGCNVTDTVTDEGSKLGHNYGEPVWTWTGYESATATFTCANDNAHVEGVTATSDAITSVITTAATCTTDGLKTYTATVTFNNQTYTDTNTETLTKLGHSFTTYVSNNNATCTEDGTKTATCDRDGCNETDTVTDEGSKLGHNYGAPVWTWTGYASATAKFTCANDNAHFEEVTATGDAITSVITTAATCTTDGLKTYTAMVTFNNQTYTDTNTETLTKLGHSFTTYVSNNNATCTEDGTKTATCDRDSCNETDTVTDEDSKLGHSFTNYVSNNDATCTADGTKTATCDRCSATDTVTDAGSKLGHNYGAPVWTWTGYASATATFTCANDNAHVEEVTATGEAITSAVTTQPTCTKEGVRTYTATVTFRDTQYSNDKEKVVAALGHSFTNYTSDNNATCTADGTKTATCDRDGCNETDTITDEGSKLGHDEIAHSAKAPTCTEIGWDAYVTCSRCDYTTYVSIPELGHDYVNDECTRCHEFRNTIGLNFAYNAATQTYAVTKYSGTSGFVRILDTYDDGINGTHNVTSIGGYAFSNCADLTSVIIPDSVTSIGEAAFEYCGNLTSVNIGNGVTNINANTFYACANLTSIIIPDSVTSIGESAFDNCRNLMNVTIGSNVDSIGKDAFSECNRLLEIYNRSSLVLTAGSYDNGYVACYAINIYTEEGGSKLSTDSNGYIIYTDGEEKRLVGYTGKETDLVLPEDISIIYNYAFYYCIEITSVIIPDTVMGIGEQAFANCNNLMSVTIGSGVTSIIDYAFVNCNKLLEVYNKSTLSITAGSSDYGYVAYCAQNVYTGEGGSKLSTDSKGYMIYTDGEEKILIGYKGSETDLTIPDGITVIIDQAFFYNCDITSVIIPDSVTHIGYSSFGLCMGLKSVTIGDGVTSIDYSAFVNCVELTSVTIGSSVTSIENSAFSGCYKLVEVYNKSSLVLTAGSDEYGSVAYYAKNVYTEEGGSKLSTDSNGYIIYTDGEEKIIVGYTGSETDLTIPDGITQINQYAFSGCMDLRSVIIGGDVTSIGACAFSDCSGLTSVTIGNGVTSIDEYAFYGCTKLTSITIGSGLTSIGDYVFLGCRGITEIIVSEENTVYHSNENCLIETASKTLVLGCKTSVIPDDGSVTSIGVCAFGDCSDLTSITIPYSVTSIGEYAFYNCSGLTSITIPDSVKSIGSEAFYSCTGLTSVIIGSGVTSIEYETFFGCAGLTSITIGGNVTSIGDSAFSRCSGLTSVTIPDSVTSIENEAFYGCSSLTNIYYTGDIASWCKISGLVNIMSTSVTLYIDGNKIEGELVIPNSVTSIGSSAFRYCVGITSVTIGSSVTSIGEWAFYGCSNLMSITIPDNVTSIGVDAFAYCNKLTSVTIGNGVTSIGKWAFDGCTSLKSLTIGSGVTSIGDYAFRDCPIETASIPALACSYIAKGSIKTLVIISGDIEGYAFEGCSGLTSVTIGNSVTSIGGWAFRECTGLTSVTIGNGVTSIGEYAFYECTALTNLTIGSGVTSIGSYAFYRCSALTSVVIPDSVTSIGNFAFYDCLGLISVTIGSGVTSIEGDYAFYCCNKLIEVYNKSSLELTAGSNAYGYVANYAKNVYTEEGGSKLSTDSNGYVIYTDGEEKIFVSYTGSETDLTLPDGITQLVHSTFNGRTDLTSVIIPDSVTRINGSAFKNCINLTSITIGSGLAEIGDYVFLGCRGITEIIVSAENTAYHSDGNCLIETASKTLVLGAETSVIPDDGSVTIIGDYAFNRCEGITSITIPDSVTKISNYVFSYCGNLTSITIGSNVTNIGSGAFNWCEKLTSITYNGTIDQWNAITKSSNWNDFTGDYMIHCTDGDITK